jgi:hypothetical protein
MEFRGGRAPHLLDVGPRKFLGCIEFRSDGRYFVTGEFANHVSDRDVLLGEIRESSIT